MSAFMCWNQYVKQAIIYVLRLYNETWDSQSGEAQYSIKYGNDKVSLLWTC